MDDDSLDDDSLADAFERHRTHLRAVAYRMLGSRAEADDAVQEAWLRLHRSDTSGVDNLGGWLTTVVGRICLDLLRSRRSRREDPLDTSYDDRASDAGDPEHQAVVADSVGAALLVVLETLTPAERLAFVLHDMFAVPFDDIAPIVGRSPVATRQLASRARRRVQGGCAEVEADPARKRAVVEAFLAASREGRFDALLAVLDPDVVVRADATAVKYGAEPELRGARSVVESFAGRAGGAQRATVNGTAGAVWAPGGRIRVVLDFTVVDDRVVAIDLRADAAFVEAADVVL